MTTQEIVAILMQLFSGKPWSPPGQEWLSIHISSSMNFLASGSGTRINVNWSPPYPIITAKKFGLGISGALKGVVIEPNQMTAIVDNLPDVSFKF